MRDHPKRMDHGFFGLGQPVAEVFLTEFVHQEPDGPAMHAVDRYPKFPRLVKRLEHETVATERYHDVGLSGGFVPVQMYELAQGFLRFGRKAGSETDLSDCHVNPHRSSPGSPRCGNGIAGHQVTNAFPSCVAGSNEPILHLAASDGDGYCPDRPFRFQLP